MEANNTLDNQPSIFDCIERWKGYLSWGPYYYAPELLIPGIAFIVSSDGEKIIAIGDDNKGSLFNYDYDGRGVSIDLQYLRRVMRPGSPFDCPSCGQLYLVLLDANQRAEDGVTAISEDTTFFRCACDFTFYFYDSLGSLSLPFDITELAPLYLAGMSYTADLFVRYVLSSDSETLVEEVGVISQQPGAVSLTDTPSFRFLTWCNPPDPSFRSQSLSAYDVRLWRARIYTLGSETFEEKTYHPSLCGWHRVIMDVRSIPDNYANSRLLESLAATSENRFDLQDRILKSARGGATRIPEYPWHDESKRTTFVNRVNELHDRWAIALDSQMEKKYEYEWFGMVKGNPKCSELCPNLLKEALKKRMVFWENGKTIPEENRPRAYALKQAAIELGVTKTKGTPKGQPYAFETLRKYYDGTLPQITKNLPR